MSNKTCHGNALKFFTKKRVMASADFSTVNKPRAWWEHKTNMENLDESQAIDIK